MRGRNIGERAFGRCQCGIEPEQRLAGLERAGGGFAARIERKARFVDEDKCIGCRQCEYAYPVLLPDADQGGFAARKAIYIPFGNAIPQVALREEENCTFCGKCESVCPVRIPLPRMMRHWREREFERKSCAS